jgi:hypothetical protein
MGCRIDPKQRTSAFRHTSAPRHQRQARLAQVLGTCLPPADWGRMDKEQRTLVHDAVTAARGGLAEHMEEDERREPTPCDTSVDFTGLNNRTCRWPLFEGHEPFYEKLYCGAPTSSGSHYCAAHAGRAFK